MNKRSRHCTRRYQKWLLRDPGRRRKKAAANKAWKMRKQLAEVENLSL